MGYCASTFQKGSDLSVYSQADLNAVALKLNTAEENARLHHTCR